MAHAAAARPILRRVNMSMEAQNGTATFSQCCATLKLSRSRMLGINGTNVYYALDFNDERKNPVCTCAKRTSGGPSSRSAGWASS